MAWVCTTIFYVEVKYSRTALGVRIKNRPISPPYLNQFSMLDLRHRVKENGIDKTM